MWQAYLWIFERFKRRSATSGDDFCKSSSVYLTVFYVYFGRGMMNLSCEITK